MRSFASFTSDRLSDADGAVVRAGTRRARAARPRRLRILHGCLAEAAAVGSLIDDAHVRDPVLLGEPLHEAEDARQEVEVLMPVRVPEPDAGGEHVSRSAPAARARPRRDGCAARSSAGRIRVVPVQVPLAPTSDSTSSATRPLLDEREVDPDARASESRAAARPRVERRAVRHDAARGHDPVLVRAQRPVGHPAMEADVVGGDDEALLTDCPLRAGRSGCGVVTSSARRRALLPARCALSRISG